MEKPGQTNKAYNAGIMKRATAAVNLFIEKQRDNEVHETFNRVNAKWTMKEIIEQIQDDNRVRKLILFFFLTSETKTWDDFQWNYDEYLDSWNEVVNAHYRRKALQMETIERGKNES